MPRETRTTNLEKIYNFLGINKKFQKKSIHSIAIDNTRVISPAQGTVVWTGGIDGRGALVSKNNRHLHLDEVLGAHAKRFREGFYINIYLSPNDDHNWVVPYDGMFSYTHVNEGKSKIPVLIGLDRWLSNYDFFAKAIVKNASISSVLETQYFPIALIAVGSLNVNGIHVSYDEGKQYHKGDYCGYFAVGSSMLVCFPKHDLLRIAKKEDKVDIGTAIVRITAKQLTPSWSL
jgi:phosphatidylserine decarboxylase